MAARRQSGKGSGGRNVRVGRFRKRHPPAGARPGTLVLPNGIGHFNITARHYDLDHLEERKLGLPEEVSTFLERPGVTWIDVEGFGDEATLRKISDRFSIHPLALEDVVNVPQRPKVEPYETCVLFITRWPSLGGDGVLSLPQISVFLGANYILTFREPGAQPFGEIVRRLQRGGGPIRRQGAGYLAYALLDAVIDAYYPTLQELGDQMEQLEEQVVGRPTSHTLIRIHQMRRTLLALRRVIWPQREAVQSLLRDEIALISPEVQMHLRDCYDHCVQAMDILESYRELGAGLLDIHLSSVSNRMNEVMKMLTIMASVFIPLTFIAGVYGMNFEFMPELHAPWAYPLVLLIMLATATGMLWFFVRRGWIGRKGGSP